MDTAARGEKRPATEDAASQPVDKKPTTNYFGISHLLNMLPSDETFKVVTDIHTTYYAYLPDVMATLEVFI
jgi:hypothetical protein